MHQGNNLVVLLGLTRDMLELTKRKLMGNTVQRSARYVGVPSSISHWRPLYKKSNLAETLKLIEHECRAFTTHRIIVLYVPSPDAGNLTSALDFVCFLAPLYPKDKDLSHDRNPIEWRNNKDIVKNTVWRALHEAWKTTNALKAEITDKRISALTLPARNFYFPDRDSTISDTYSSFMQQTYIIPNLKDRLLPTRFTRDQLPKKAFKGKQHTDEFFQDRRGRVFPPDLFHGQSRREDSETTPSRLSVVLRQKFRFGVTVRDGNLHYDVQYEYPRKLRNELMHCATTGDVWVTGSHANIGVNDVVWVPDGTKEPRNAV